MKIQPVVVVSRNEDERVLKLGAEFRKFLGEWFSMVVLGVNFTPRVSRELALALAEYAAAAVIATSDVAQNEPDNETADRCERVARLALEVIEREVVS